MLATAANPHRCSANPSVHGDPPCSAEQCVRKDTHEAYDVFRLFLPVVGAGCLPDATAAAGAASVAALAQPAVPPPQLDMERGNFKLKESKLCDICVK